ncbi:MAG: diaminobutyrate--2-oxoglutarate transaminase [Oscillospiraceae bacterium]|nr:diaminobutyrate--2-oxoglutarate transaminase [Oscillospiraceae bacterium]
MNIFDQMESDVRSYCRSFPVVFNKAKMSDMFTDNGDKYIDFFCGAGALNYGHNNDYIIDRIIDYLRNSGIMHSLDMHTTAKAEFMKCFCDKILKPRNLDYKLMFCGPTGTNANEAALKIARKYTGRTNVFSFMGAFHGMSLGSLALTSSDFSRDGAGVPLGNVTFMPFPFGFNETFDTIGYIENVLNDDHSGIEKPAAIFCETVQAEGGIIPADKEWLVRLRDLCTRHGILLVCDEVQVGCGRTGTFFSFERAGIAPDMVSLSKSISGSGLPMSLLLIKPEYDCFKPGEHNGTFRGNQLAFVGAKAAIDFAVETGLYEKVNQKGIIIEKFVRENILPLDSSFEYRGIGLIHGIDFSKSSVEDACGKIAHECFSNGLVIERAGRRDDVLKIMPALTIEEDELMEGLKIIETSVKNVFGFK